MKSRIFAAFLVAFSFSTAASASSGAALFETNFREPVLDSLLASILKSNEQMAGNLDKFPTDGSPIDETLRLLMNLQFTLQKTKVLLEERDFAQTTQEKSPQYTAFMHHALGKFWTLMADYCARTGDVEQKKSCLDRAIPHLIDVNAYFLDNETLRYTLFGNELEITPDQHKAVTSLASALKKKKK